MLSRSSFTLLLIGLMVSEFLIGDVSGAPPERNVNEKDINGQTALHRAALAGKEKEAQNLIAEGADPNIENYIFQTPLDYAAMKGHKNVAEVLLNNGANIVDLSSPLDYAAKNGHKNVAELLIKKGAKVNIKHALQLAIANGHTNVAKLLTSKGNRINIEEQLE